MSWRLVLTEPIIYEHENWQCSLDIGRTHYMYQIYPRIRMIAIHAYMAVKSRQQYLSMQTNIVYFLLYLIGLVKNRELPFVCLSLSLSPYLFIFMPPSLSFHLSHFSLCMHSIDARPQSLCVQNTWTPCHIEHWVTYIKRKISFCLFILHFLLYTHTHTHLHTYYNIIWLLLLLLLLLLYTSHWCNF